MKKKFQKFSALFAVLAVLLAALPVLPASALNTSTDFQYEVLSEQDKTCALVSYQGFDAVLEIPTQIDGYTVTTIRGGCFTGYASYMLEELTIPDSVTTLEDGALQSCFSLRSVRLPETLEKIGAHVFESCTAMESIEIPASVTTIDDYAFYKLYVFKRVCFSGELDLYRRLCILQLRFVGQSRGAEQRYRNRKLCIRQLFVAAKYYAFRKSYCNRGLYVYRLQRFAVGASPRRGAHHRCCRF